MEKGLRHTQAAAEDSATQEHNVSGAPCHQRHTHLTYLLSSYWLPLARPSFRWTQQTCVPREVGEEVGFSGGKMIQRNNIQN